MSAVRGALWGAGLAVLLASAAAVWLLADGVQSEPASAPPMMSSEERIARSMDLPTAVPTDARAQPLRAEPEGRSGRGGGSSARADLGPERSVSGLVTRLSDGSPLPGARVGWVRVDEGLREFAQWRSGVRPEELARLGDWLNDQGRSVDGATTNAEGLFQLAVPESVFLLTVHYEGRNQHERLPDGHVDDLRVEFDSGFRIRGFVLGQDDVPVPAARVRLEDLPAHPGTRADASGHYQLDDVAPEPGAPAVDVRVQAEWYESRVVAARVPDDVREIVPIDIRLVGSGALQGVVRDLAGKPIARPRVVLRVHSTAAHGELMAQPLSDTGAEDGSYRIASVPAGRWLLSAQAQGHGERWIHDVAVQVGETTWLDIRLGPGASLTGRVTDSAGSPLPDVTVLVERFERWESNVGAGPGQGGTSITGRFGVHLITELQPLGSRSRYISDEAETETDDDGTYVVEGLSPGEKRLTVSDSTERGLGPQRRTLFLGDEAAPGRADFVLAPGLALAGRVIDENGHGLADVDVTAEQQVGALWLTQGEQTTAPDGGFRIIGLGQGPHELVVQDRGWLELRQPATPGDDHVVLVLRRAPRMEGLVRDARDRRPLGVFDLTLVQADGRLSLDDQQDEGGRFSVALWDDEPYDVTVSVGGYRSQTRTGVRPSSTRDAPLVFELQPNPP